MTVRGVRLIYLVAAGSLVVAYYAVPAQRALVDAALGTLSVAAVGWGLVVARPPRSSGWMLIALAVGLLAAGDVVYDVAVAGTPGSIDYPGVADVFYLLAYLPLAAGLLVLAQAWTPSRDWALVLDATALTLAGSLLVWVFLVRPAAASLQLTQAGKVTAVASWVGYVAVLAAAARMIVAWRANRALGLLAIGVAAFLVADFFYGRDLVTRSWVLGTPTDLGYLAFTVLVGAAALTEAMGDAGSPVPGRHQLGPLRLTLLAVGLLVAPTVLLVEATPGPVTTGVAIAMVSGTVGILMLVRLSMTARDYRRRVHRERVIGTASRAQLLATSEGEAIASISRAVADLLPKDTTFRVRTVSGAATFSTPVDGEPGELVVPVAGTQQSVAFTAPAAMLGELAPSLEALADQTGQALRRIDLLNITRAAERERYFRTLVLSSDDVTLISRGGRIAYATPSAVTLFGRPITGERLEDLVQLGTADRDNGKTDGWFTRDGRTVEVLVRTRDLRDEPTVTGLVTTLRDVTTERRLRRDLAYRANHDALTGLANAQRFTDELHASHPSERRTRRGAGRAALFVDLDDFKLVNDTYGHELGDRLLIEVAQRIGTVLRYEDLAARLGGDEFAILLRHLDGVEDARRIAQRVVDALARPTTVDGITMDCQASVGVAYAGPTGSADTLVREADAALYAAKAGGKGRWREYRPGLPVPGRRHVEGRRRLEDGLQRDAFTLHYQPIVELDTGRPIGFEALIRLPDVDPPMSADDIVTTAEDTGLITTVGDWVLRQALADLATLNPPGTGRRRYVSVNVSARQLRQPDFVEMVRGHLAAVGADPNLVVLEVTENLLIDDDRAWRFLADLRAEGIKTAIDDYGTGYASLSYLRQPVLDIVKIDRSFVTDLTIPRNQVLIEAVMTLCHDLGLTPIAEGVPDAATAGILLASGCPYGQGFHYAPAMPPQQAARWTHTG